MLPRLATSATLAVMAGARDVILFCSALFEFDLLDSAVHRMPEEEASHAFSLNGIQIHLCSEPMYPHLAMCHAGCDWPVPGM